MAGRLLNTEETVLWARVMKSVRPLRPVPMAKAPPATTPLIIGREPSPAVAKALSAARRVSQRPVVAQPAVRDGSAANTLDGGWDKRLAKGVVSPDASIDLHGHTLASAHAMLDAGLGRSIARGDRVLLLVTGKPPRAESERPHARGAIRAAVSDWLAISRHAHAIAAVRGAHPRHGGAGALYIVLRRAREQG